MMAAHYFAAVIVNFLVIPKKLVALCFTIKIIYLMARVSNTLIGKASGSVGNATFSTWKGINVLKEKAVSVANPNTDLQIMRRSALSQTVAIYRQISAAVQVGFKKLATGMSSYNAWARNALKDAFDYSAAPVATFVGADLKISKGTISATAMGAIVADVSNATITVAHSITVDAPGQSLTDLSILAAYNSTLNEWASSSNAGLRNVSPSSMPLPGAWVAGNNVQVYLGFYNAASGESSDSVNGSSVIVA
jgi:Family of unknown function (DUF6266)